MPALRRLIHWVSQQQQAAQAVPDGGPNGVARAPMLAPSGATESAGRDDTDFRFLAHCRVPCWPVVIGLVWISAIPCGAQVQVSPSPAFPARALPQPEIAAPAVSTKQTSPATVPTYAPVVPSELPPGTFTLRRVVLEGVHVYPVQELEAIYRDLLNREIPYTEVYGIANRITAKYHADGYALSQAFAPGQQIQNGVVRIWVAEGALARYQIQGSPGGNRRVIERYAKRLLEMPPLRMAALQRYLLLMNDLPGSTVAGYVVPGDRGLLNATLILSTNIKKHRGSVRIDNRGSEFFGPGAVYGNFRANALLGTGELIEVSPIVTGPGDGVTSYGGFVNFRAPVFSEGAYVQAYFAGSSTRPGGSQRALDVNGLALIGTLAYGYPLIRELDQYLYATGQFDLISTEEDIFGSQAFVKDTLRVLRGHLNYGFADAWGGENFADFRLSLGIDGLGASDDTDPLRSRINADADFVALRFSVQRRQALDAITDDLRFLVRAAG